ncbi:MAG: ABC transporter ATP-binding protein [Coprobacillaceae bacterium]
MSNILIEANRISKIYDPDIFLKRGKNFYALNQVDFILKEGDFISIMGPSGSGKSTMLNCISGLDTISKGSLTIFEKPIATLNDNELSTFRYKYLGFIFQDHNLISTLSIYDNIATPIMLANHSPEEINERIQKLAVRLQITDILEKKPNECSGGEKQRAAIARALINNPRIIVCDEPTGNLDSTNSHEVLSILSDLNKQGISIVVVTHDNMIASYAKQFMYLRDGQIHTVLHRGESAQEDFFSEIVKVTTQDSLLKFFKKTTSSDEEVTKSTTTKVKKEVIDNSKKAKIESVYAIFPTYEERSPEADNNRQLTVSDDKMSYTNISHENVDILYTDIIDISLTLKPVYKNFGMFSEYQFPVQMNVITKTQKYFFILVNVNDLTPLFNLLVAKGITLKDPINLQEIYRQHPTHLPRIRYMQSQMKSWKKKYNI